MPNPIEASTEPNLCALSDDVTAEENDAQMSLSAAHASAAPLQSPGGAPPPAAAAPSPAVSALVSRFTTRAGTHPSVAPSLGKAIWNCGLEELNFLGSAGAIMAAVPETLGASLLAVFRLGTGAALVQRCLQRDEAEQVQDGNRANLAADCRSEGAIPLTTTDGAVACAK